MDGEVYIEEPIFLVGALRAGTTMLRLMLDHHPDVAIPNEYEFLVGHMPGGRFPGGPDYAAWVRTFPDFDHMRLEVDDALDFRQQVNHFLIQAKRRTGKNRVGCCVHNDFERLPLIWPKAKYIHLQRDGRDVALSSIRMGWAGNAWYGADTWLAAMRSWDALTDAVPSENWMELRFEDLVSEPAARLAQVCDFVGVPYDEAMLTYPNDTTYAAPDPSLTYQWKRKMAAKDKALLEYRLAERLAASGYETGAASPRQPNALEQLALALENKRGKLRFRCNRYGTGLVLKEFFARKAGLAGWQSALAAEMQTIRQRHIK